MNQHWVNEFGLCYGGNWESADIAQFAADEFDRALGGFVRVQHYMVGNAYRPPVGMRADQASHVWKFNGWIDVMYLEPRP